MFCVAAFIEHNLILADSMSVDDAMEWLIAHESTADADEPILKPRSGSCLLGVVVVTNTRSITMRNGSTFQPDSVVCVSIDTNSMMMWHANLIRCMRG